MLREAVLMGTLTGLLLLVGYALGSYFGDPLAFVQGALILSALFNFLAYAFSDSIVLAMTGAKIVGPDEEPELHSIVEELAKEAGIPKPKVAIVSMPIPNAFATGRGPKRAVVAVTRGLTEVLSKDEVKAVLSHEISHIKHRDTLIAAMAATIAGAIAYLAYAARWLWFLGVPSEDRRESAGGIALLLSALLAPIAATLIQLAISREREYRADEGGARITKNPFALAKALVKIERAVARGSRVRLNPATSHLWIVNPIRGDAFAELFSTHPPTSKRIARLKKLAREMRAPWDDRELERLSPPLPRERASASAKPGLEQALLRLLLEEGEVSSNAIPGLLTSRLGLHASDAEVREALERLIASGHVYVKDSFILFSPFGTYTSYTLALTPKGTRAARRLRNGR